MYDGWIKNICRAGIKALNKRKYDRYINDIRARGKNLPDFTLLTSDCMGGLIYHTLGRQFLSPTINLSIKDSDFLKLISDLPYYFSQEFLFKEWTNYPVGSIGEESRKVEVRFEHYKTEEDAVAKWNDRKMRLTNDIYVIMADLDLSNEELESFKQLNKRLNVKRKIMFTWNKNRADGKEIFFVNSYGRQRVKSYSKLRKDGFRDYEIFFDYIKWMKMEDDFMLDRGNLVDSTL